MSNFSPFGISLCVGSIVSHFFYHSYLRSGPYFIEDKDVFKLQKSLCHVFSEYTFSQTRTISNVLYNIMIHQYSHSTISLLSRKWKSQCGVVEIVLFKTITFHLTKRNTSSDCPLVTATPMRAVGKAI